MSSSFVKYYAPEDSVSDDLRDLHAHHGDYCTLYVAREVDAALAAKDAENNRIRHALEQLLIDSNGKVRADHWNRAMSALEMNDAPPTPHPDAARLDKLPQCFHMLRFAAVTGKWWLTYDPDNEYNNPRDVLDAHQEPKP